MTDVEMQRIKTICDVAGVDDIGDLSDGFHTFNSLYEQRMILFAALVKIYKDKAWKSYRHEDGEYCFGGGWFIVGIDTPEGSYTYHYENKYFDLFDCKELACAKHWDGHTEKDVTRLLTLPSAQPQYEELDFVQEHKKLPIILETRDKAHWIEVGREEGALGIGYKRYRCSKCGWESSLPIPRKFCPECGSDMKGEQK